MTSSPPLSVLSTYDRWPIYSVQSPASHQRAPYPSSLLSPASSLSPGLSISFPPVLSFDDLSLSCILWPRADHGGWQTIDPHALARQDGRALNAQGGSLGNLPTVATEGGGRLWPRSSK